MCCILVSLIQQELCDQEVLGIATAKFFFFPIFDFAVFATARTAHSLHNG
jgi:hypothetical protein